jgi:hypothetical protein
MSEFSKPGSGKLQETFETHGERVNDISYRHPNEQSILPELEKTLLGSQTGKRLLETVKGRKIPVRLIKGSNIYGFSPEGKAAYVGVPVEKNLADGRMILELAAALRSAEQEILGFANPESSADPLEFAAMHHAKNLDLVIHMCKVAYEVDKSNDNNNLQETLEEMGHGGLYDAYVRDFAPDELVDIYYDQDQQQQK